MKPKDKIRIIHSKLNAFLNEFKTKNSFYYASLEELRIYNDFIFDEDLNEDEQQFINEALSFKRVVFGTHKYNFEVEE